MRKPGSLHQARGWLRGNKGSWLASIWFCIQVSITMESAQIRGSHEESQGAYGEPLHPGDHILGFVVDLKDYMKERER